MKLELKLNSVLIFLVVPMYIWFCVLTTSLYSTSLFAYEFWGSVPSASSAAAYHGFSPFSVYFEKYIMSFGNFAGTVKSCISSNPLKISIPIN